MATKTKKKLSLNEIFDKIQKYRYIKERVRCLQREESFALKTVLQLAFNDRVYLDLPEGAPPFAQKNAENTDYDLNEVIKPIGRCVPTMRIPTYKKEGHFLDILQAISKEEAEILIAAKDKVLHEKYNRLTKELVVEAFPKIL
jgi:hypothetical protein